LGPLLGVVVDGWALPKPPFQVFEALQEHRVDLLLGTNARELTRPFFPVTGLIWHSRAGNTAYQFQFSRVPPEREAVGAAHGSELAYVFGTLAIAGRSANAPKYVSADETVSDQMQQYWTNFAKNGQPQPKLRHR
jgi:carboxylesterase type B